MRGIRGPAFFALAALLSVACMSPLAGCGGAPRSTGYFALEEGNSWLYEGAADGVEYSLEVKVTAPDPTLGTREGISDLAVTGTLGDFTVSEQGLFLEAGPDEVKLWGVSRSGSPPEFYSAPYVWLAKPLEVGREYNTAIQGAPTPAVMVVTGTVEEATPWGEREGFTLEEKGGSGPAGGVRLVFVPFLGFTRIAMPGLPELVLKDAALE